MPEWYFVFNPVEYAQYLATGHNPSEFPFFASIESDGRSRIVSTLRWGPFSEVTPQLTAAGDQFRDISGNRRIVVSVVSPVGAKLPLIGAAGLLTAAWCQIQHGRGVSCSWKVGQLATFLQNLRASVTLEHIYYDYSRNR